MRPPSLQTAMAPYLRRARVRAMSRGSVDGILVGALVAGVTLLSHRLLGIGTPLLAACSLAIAVPAGLLVARVRLPDDGTLLTSLDADLGLKARVRTAWESGAAERHGPLAQAQIRDAVTALNANTPRDWLPRLLPRRAWGMPLAVGLAASALLAPSRGEAGAQLSAPERTAISAAAEALSDDRALSGRLRDAESVEEALAALADYEERAETYRESRRALDMVRDALPQPARNSSPADALTAATPASYPALQERLRGLRDRLARNATTGGLAQALDDIEMRAVTEATLQAIIDELRELEGIAQTAPLTSLDEIRAQERAVALAAIDVEAGGTQARTDGVAGAETGDMVAQGSRIPDAVTVAQAADAMLLESLESAAIRESRVYTRARDADGRESEPVSMPFREAVANARAETEYAVRNDELPVAYRDRIRRYFDALQRIAEEDAP
ncbi:hypothetical protein HN371_16740 [Candidatus Poribacteria bacterium]|jgi:hypothetical protein|nr:hypothetical protein [Candidatus Poribacteria bacterium]MBT5536740.1 hypothetical protein [Candidatus Poribacteria bacterium]MBT7805596.1 hypothetical protein [Candidatus Poribacteria bacterium]